MTTVSELRAAYSNQRIEELRSRLADLTEFQKFENLAVFGAGSYARLEASEYSDIDMFFLSANKIEDGIEEKIRSLSMFGKTIETIEEMRFPKFSNDGEYLVVLNANEILSNLGSRTDDHENYFTARMLMLLESQCLYGDHTFDSIVESVVRSYFKDYPNHRDNFQPIFLLNDIGRFWKTMLLNYEHKRGFRISEGESQERKTKQKVRNFKLKYSRMTTCFASVAAFGSCPEPFSERDIVNITKITPRARLQLVADNYREVRPLVDRILQSYDWFLEMTGHPTEELESHFSDKSKRSYMFERASEYGDEMFALLQALDLKGPNRRLVRHLVI